MPSLPNDNQVIGSVPDPCGVDAIAEECAKGNHGLVFDLGEVRSALGDLEMRGVLVVDDETGLVYHA